MSFSYRLKVDIEGNRLTCFLAVGDFPAKCQRLFLSTKKHKVSTKNRKVTLLLLCSDWCVFDPHINEPRVYKPWFFQFRHHKSCWPGEALFVCIPFFAYGDIFPGFSNCSFKNNIVFSTVLFRTISLHCSFKNNIVHCLCLVRRPSFAVL